MLQQKLKPKKVPIVKIVRIELEEKKSNFSRTGTCIVYSTVQ